MTDPPLGPPPSLPAAADASTTPGELAVRDDRSARVDALISLLLRYPDPALVEDRDAVMDAAAALPASAQRTALLAFLDYWSRTPLAALAQDYVATFDLQKRCGLYLSYYLYGDKRQRGVAFLRLKRLYAAAGWELATRELPDYLPLMLEFAASGPAGHGELLLQEFRPGLELLRRALHDLASPYAHLLDAIVLGLPRLTRGQQELVERLAADGPPSELVGIEPFAPPEVMPPIGGRRG
jgi:nitrate reductase delta subunit